MTINVINKLIDALVILSYSAYVEFSLFACLKGDCSSIKNIKVLPKSGRPRINKAKKDVYCSLRMIRALIGWLQVRGFPGPVMDFSPFSTFSNTLSVANASFGQAVRPGVLQTFSTCAVKP